MYFNLCSSLTGLGTELNHKQDRKDVTLDSWSKSLNPVCFIESVKAVNNYLAGGPIPLTSEHAAFPWLPNFESPGERLVRQLEHLAPYSFRVVYTSGTSIGNEDALSRRSQRPCKGNCTTYKKLEEKDAAIRLVKLTTMNK